ncbi:MAG: cytochrome c oxidase subunit II [Bacteroidales bacterium]|nr:cytochrome c oxidase subunit II [Bacteroidales bacterium]
MFSNFSNLAHAVDTAFVIILSVIFFFLISLTVLMVVFIFKYRASKNPVATQIEGNNKLEIMWTIVPLLIVLAMFYFGWTGWKPMYSKAPDNALEITATARMWNWSFGYSNGHRKDTLYLPAGRPVKLNLEALDVIHSLYIPAFRVKQDMVPGKEASMWFIANTPGSYDLYCTEYCGLRHSYMYTTVEVLPEADFNKWLSDTTARKSVATAGLSPERAGQKILEKTGCNACHSIDGTKLVGPSYKGLFGKVETVVSKGSEKTLL